MARKGYAKKIIVGDNIIYPVTVSDAVMHPELEKSMTEVIEDILSEKIILTEEEYENLGDRKDPEKFYFTYEEDDE